jgi:hypothetical protein
MKAKSISMWAVIVKSKRTEWIHWPTIRATRRDTRLAYEDEYIFGDSGDECRERFEARLKSGQVRLARVTISEQ